MLDVAFWMVIVASLGSTLAALVTWRLALAARPLAARVAFRVGLAVLALGVVGALAALVNLRSASGATGLSEADRQRMLSNASAEAMYNTLFALLIGLPPTIVGRLLRPRAAAERHEDPA